MLASVPRAPILAATLPGPDRIVGPDVLLPGSEHLAPIVFGAFTAAAVVAVLVTSVVRFRRARRDDRRRPVVLVALVVVALVGAGLTVRAWPPPFFTPEFPPLGRLFPDEAFFHRPAQDLTVHPDSDRMLAAMGDRDLVAAFGGPYRTGSVLWGIPFNLVDAGTPEEIVRYRRDWSPYAGGVPIADPAYIENVPTYGFDSHYVALDRARRSMWELIGTTVWFGRWEADAGARWDLDSLDYGEYSTTASGLPLLPGVIGFDEVDAGSIDHVIWAVSPDISSTDSVWPARATDGMSDDPEAPPMGTWMRLRADFDLSGLGPQARVVAVALQRHGLVLMDSSPTFALIGTPDARFDPDDLATLRRLGPSDFDIVDHADLMVDSDSMAARPAAPAGGG